MMTKQEIIEAIENLVQNSYEWDSLILAKNLTTILEGLMGYIAGKQDILTFDNVPTENSNNPVTSGAVYSSLSSLSESIIDLASQHYLIFYAEEDGVITWVRDNHVDLSDKTIQYSRDLGATWQDLTVTVTSESINVSAGDYIFLKGNNENYAVANIHVGGTTWYRTHLQVTGSTYIFGNLGALVGWSRTIADNAFATMFEGNSNLHTYEFRKLFLHCDTLGKNCLANLFKNCAGIVYPMELPNVDVIADGAYWSLYQYCTSLIEANDITATTLEHYACLRMYQGCASLREAGKISATTLGEACCGSMYKDCTSLVIGHITPATELSRMGYQEMFEGCTALTTIDNVEVTALAGSSLSRTFYNCTSLVSSPITISAQEIPDYACLYTFYGCTSLVNAQVTLPATKVGYQGCFGMFQECSALPAVPAPMATTLAEAAFGCYAQDCTSITEAYFPPATTLAASCYRQMYLRCSLITSVTMPIVPTLVNSCYNRTFRHCTSLAEVTCLATDISASNCLELWLDDVAATGTFTKDTNTIWPSGVNGIPDGWSIVNA